MKSLWLSICAIVATHISLLTWLGLSQSPTNDEIAHLPAGLAIWESGRFDLYRVNPPLVKTLAALPIRGALPATDWKPIPTIAGARPEWDVGRNFIAANPRTFLGLFTLARWACIPLSLIGALVCYRWAAQLYGAPAGLLALILWCFSPNILAHASLITPDVGAASLGLLASWRFWSWLRLSTLMNALLAGLALGAAELTKFTWLILFGLWPLLWLVWTTTRPPTNDTPPLSKQAFQLAGILLLGLILLNAGYGFRGSFQRLDQFEFVTRTLGGPDRTLMIGDAGNRFRGTLLGDLAVPLPRDYVVGLDLQKCDFEQGHRSYLRGEWKYGGWWYYYIYALLIKAPLGSWVLAGLALALPIALQPQSVRWQDHFVLLAPAVLVFAIVSSQTGFNDHFRYVLPAFPFCFIAIGRAARWIPAEPTRRGAVALFALAWSVGSSLWIYPHSLSYFNEIIGGPRHGPAHLLGSNVDWAQDLLRFKWWRNEHPEVQPLYVGCTGLLAPSSVGIDALSISPLSPDTEIPPGWYALSVNLIHGESVQEHRSDGTRTTVAPDGYERFRRLRPVARIGYTIRIFYIPPSPEPPAKSGNVEPLPYSDQPATLRERP